jgi:hypothetical protein
MHTSLEDMHIAKWLVEIIMLEPEDAWNPLIVDKMP